MSEFLKQCAELMSTFHILETLSLARSQRHCQKKNAPILPQSIELQTSRAAKQSNQAYSTALIQATGTIRSVSGKQLQRGSSPHTRGPSQRRCPGGRERKERAKQLDPRPAGGESVRAGGRGELTSSSSAPEESSPSSRALAGAGAADDTGGGGGGRGGGALGF